MNRVVHNEETVIVELLFEKESEVFYSYSH